MSKKKNGKGPKGDDAKGVKITIPAELAEAVEAAGGSLQETVERLLRDALGQPTADRAKRKIAGFLQDIAGPHLPQLEAIAKDVASKVAKDVATAAAAAALTTFAARAAGEKETAKASAPKAAARPAAKAGPKPAAKAAAKPRKPAAKKSAPKAS